ncbi:MAG: PTS transporter subunit EIIC [Anaerovibrio sp.]|uniref:PTS transporter subunit EIIC n=1 Tax=Anaerovibrio sp. TaxID=1872532 RepID=UPI0025D0441B|nr:PTS transporter subunit EIIC [Anaerovibrio sp.]MCR5175522.1 PTS transporter subunit EIIC [Anaerovibrio sp.]
MGKYFQDGVLFNKQLSALSRYLHGISYLSAIHDTFCRLMPVIIVLTLIHMMGFLVFNPTGFLLGEDWLGLGSILSGTLNDQAYRDSDFFVRLNYVKSCLQTTTILLSMIFALVLTIKLSNIWNCEHILPLSCTLTAYIVLINTLPKDYDISIYFLGAGFFLALLFASTSAFVFSRLTRIEWLQLPVVGGLPKDMSTTIVFLPSMACTLVIVIAIASIWTTIESYILTFIPTIASTISDNFAQSPLVAIIYECIRSFLWWLGLDGGSLTYFLCNAFYVPNQISNELNDEKFIFTIEFLDSNSVSLLGLAISIWVFSAQRKIRKISSFCFPTLLCGINAPFLFSLPIVLNPLFIMPYLLTSMLNFFIGYLAIHWNIVPIFYHTVESTAPVFLQGFLATGDIMGAVLQLVWLSVDVVIYTPFVIMLDLISRNKSWKEVGKNGS